MPHRNAVARGCRPPGREFRCGVKADITWALPQRFWALMPLTIATLSRGRRAREGAHVEGRPAKEFRPGSGRTSGFW